MSNPYVGEIRMFAGNFPPSGWAFCDGTPIPISENDVLFQLIGTTYGGDGQNTFDLPNLSGRVPVHMGTGPFGSTYTLGESGGVEAVTLTTQQIPVHTHAMTCNSGSGNGSGNPANSIWYASDVTQYSDQGSNGSMNAQILPPAGGSQPHDNMIPFLGINFILSLFGLFPTQT